MNTDNERFISFMALTQRGVSESGGQFGVGRGGDHTRLRVFRAAPSLPGCRIHGLLRVGMRCRYCTKVQARFPARAPETTREGACGPLRVTASKGLSGGEVFRAKVRAWAPGPTRDGACGPRGGKRGGWRGRAWGLWRKVRCGRGRRGGLRSRGSRSRYRCGKRRLR